MWKQNGDSYYQEDKVTIDSYGGRPILHWRIRKLSNGMWETLIYNPIMQGYMPFIPDYPTKEVKPRTGVYKTLTDAKNAFDALDRRN